MTDELKKDFEERIPIHLIDELLILPAKIKEIEEKLVGLNLKINDRKRAVDLWDLEESRRVTEASDEDNKKKYPNKEIRDAELEKRKRNSKEYQSLMEDLVQAESDKYKEVIEFNFLERKWKSLIKLAEIFCRR